MRLKIVNIHEAKTHFSKLVNAVMHGKEIIIAMAGNPIAKLCPIPKGPKRKFGYLKGKIKIAQDFDAPLPDEILKDFEA